MKYIAQTAMGGDKYPSKLHQIGCAIFLLTLGNLFSSEAVAQVCTGDSDNAVVSQTSSQDGNEGTSTDASPQANSGSDQDAPAGQAKVDPSGNPKHGDQNDGGGTKGDPGGTDASGEDSTLMSDVGDMMRDLAAASFDAIDGFGQLNGSLAGVNIAGGREQLWHAMEDPVDVTTADKTHVQVDYQSLGANPIRMARSYHSNATQNTANVTVPMGAGWHMFYDRSLQQVSSSQINLHRANGAVVVFNFNGSSWIPTVSAGVLTPYNGGWVYYNLRDTIETYNSAGRLLGMSDEGLTVQLQYDQSGRLSRVQNVFGRALTFGYDGSGRISTVGLPDSTHLTYGYDNSNNLISVAFNDGTIRQYAYENQSFRNALTGIIDESGRRRLTWTYDSSGRPSGSYYGQNENPSTISYIGTQVVTTDARGTQRTRNLSTVNGQVVVSSATTGSTANSAPTAWNFGFDAAGNLQAVTTRTGETQQFSNDSRGRPVSQTRAAGTSIAATSTITWHPTFNVPTQTVAAGVTTNYSIDGSGRITQISKTSGPSTVVTYSANYNFQGLLQSTTDAHGVVINYAYDGSGNLTSITNQTLQQTTTFSNYTLNGRPQTIQRPDGVVISRTFDSRERMLSRSTPDGTTNYSYDAAGRLLQIYHPDGSFVTRAYDSAGLLTSVTNNRGETTTIARDTAAAITGTNTYNSGGVLTAQTKRTIDAVGRTSSIVDSRGYSTQIEYAADGRPSGASDPLGRAATVQLDALNRPVTLIQPNTAAMRQSGGPPTTTNQYVFSSLNTRSNIIDANAVGTSYGYDGFRRRVSEGSNDAGNSSVILNAAGDIVSHTDPLGSTIGLSRDAIGRVVALTYGNITDRTFAYVPGRSDGRLASVTDSTGGSMNWGYDAGVRVLTQQQTVYGLQQTVRISRDTLGRPTSVTYPSGMVLGLTYNTDLVSGLTINGATLLNSISYQPQSSAAANWRWGNGSSYSRTFDADGRITSVTLGSVQRTYGYDAAGQITSETDASTAGTKQYSFDYDELGHLISFASPTVSQSYAYDSNGNRRADSGSLSNSTYSYTAGTNRVSTGAGDSYQYSSDGTPSTVLTSLQYNTYRQLAQITTSSTKATYGYNALGQRDLALMYHYVACGPGGGMQSVASSSRSNSSTESLPASSCTNWRLTGTRRYVYDDRGRLLGEYDSTTGYSQETVWFNNQPVATVINGVTYYINSDNVGAPRSIVRASDNIEIWRWDSDPFGATAPSAPNPSAGSITYNLRFPGQIAGFIYYQNGARDYNPNTGRYLEPDPSGLSGGISRYSYAGGNPVSIVDPYGLDTLQIGVGGTATLGPLTGLGGAGIAIDSKYNISGYWYIGPAGSVGVNEGFGVSIQVSNAKTVNDLGGWFTNTSVSGGLAVGGTIDTFSGMSGDGMVTGGGATVGEDIGVSGAIGKTYTWLTGTFNPISAIKKLFCHS